MINIFYSPLVHVKKVSSKFNSDFAFLSPSSSFALAYVSPEKVNEILNASTLIKAKRKRGEME